MLRIICTEEVRGRPILDCDICGDQIEDAGLAAVVFSRTGTDCKIGEKTDSLVVHKGNCHKVAESRWRKTTGKETGWMELSIFLARLMLSSKIGLDQVSALYDSVNRWEEWE